VSGVPRKLLCPVCPVDSPLAALTGAPPSRAHLRLTRAARVILFQVIALLHPRLGLAQGAPADGQGIEVGIRGGYGLPFGERIAGEPFNRTVDRAISVAVDAGYRFTPYLYAGGLLSYASVDPDKMALTCDTFVVIDGPGDCSGSAIRLAADVQLRAPLGEGYVGWLATGAGLERLAIDYESGCWDGPFSRVDTGFEIAHLEAGAGLRVNSGLVVGPFASYALGLFRTSKTSGSCNGGGAIPDKSAHGLLTLGLRGMYTLPFSRR
jgi:hypothetical protein